MEQIQKLFEILQETPQMALWGLVIYFLFILLKLASWVYALKVIIQLFINRYFDTRNKELDQSEASQLLKYWKDNTMVANHKEKMIELVNAMKDDGRYIGTNDIDRAIKLIKGGQG